MNLFQEIKAYVTARQAAEQYGIKINRNKMHAAPSMMIIIQYED